MCKKNRVQVTLDDADKNFMIEDMKRKDIIYESEYFRSLLRDRKNNKDQMLDHVLQNSRDTNKKVMILLELLNYIIQQEKYHGTLVPLDVAKTEVTEDAELAVKNKLAKLREIKLNNVRK